VPSSARDVFINCPFDDAFAQGFQALVFAVLACGFRARCAREMDDAAETRIDKLYRIIAESRYSIHDLSRTQLDAGNQLPRFNMPLELGIFLGAKHFGDDDQAQKRCMILDTLQYRFQMFISDLAGMDIKAHAGDPRAMVQHVRDFLRTVSRRRTIPPTVDLLDSYDRFAAALPVLAATSGLDPVDLRFPDFERLVQAWVKAEHSRPEQAPTAPIAV
jgi:hypothetical protein